MKKIQAIAWQLEPESQQSTMVFALGEDIYTATGHAQYDEQKQVYYIDFIGNLDEAVRVVAEASAIII